jgi:alanyl-tRNA synthetase
MNKTLSQIREKFTDFFTQNDHTIVSSSPLIPYNDPSLMFVNSGMVQFKNVFTGHETRNYTKAVSAQKSVRAGGKHNDLDNVGYTARHHTFFEMLGNFSFGDYFKEEAIKYAWDLLTKEFCLPIEKLYVTVYHSDHESAELWRKIAGLKSDRIIQIKTLDNFWSMGDIGPCGPCSEIFYDHGESVFGGPPGSKDQDGDRFVEIWNLVFMEFEQINRDERIALPNKSIDTGMGLERISAALQGVHDNYDIDLFKEIIGYAESLFETPSIGDNKFSYRVIADHLRSIAFLIADGVMPSNEGRGYVLRRIMRRSMRHASLLKKNEPIIYKLLPRLIELMGAAYPELKRAEEFIGNILQQEEIRFYSMLERGLKLLDEQTAGLKRGGVLTGDIAFKLYDTYGFPLDLTEDILRSKEIKVDTEEFNHNMEGQKQKARSAWVGSGASKEDKIWFDIKSECGATEFLGYALDNMEAKVLALVQDNEKLEKISSARLNCHPELDSGSKTHDDEILNQVQDDSRVRNDGGEFIIITNQTPFYGESGGQMGDIGLIEGENCRVKVVNTLKYQSNIHAHICILEEGQIAVGDNVHLAINTDYRNNLRGHHSATHILHAVLRDILGKHVTQKGSLVAEDHLRFDFSHPNALSAAEIELIEDKVNQIIMANSKVHTNLMSTQEAIDAGAMALFGERYDDEVRVVSIPNRKNCHPELDSVYSFELCGGTHVARTGDIGAFKIINEHAVAAGIRRIEAICGKSALKRAKENEELLHKIANELKATKSEIIVKINNLQATNKDLEKELSKLKLSLLKPTTEELDQAKQIYRKSYSHPELDSGSKRQSNGILNQVQDDNKGYKLVYKIIEDFDIKTMRLAVSDVVSKDGGLAVIYISKTQGKLLIVMGIGKDLKDDLDAGKIVEKIAGFLGGTGGGSKLLAQGTGVFVNKLHELEGKIAGFLE